MVIFVKSVARAKELNKLLVECNFPSICIHSAQKQEERCGAPADWNLCLRWSHYRRRCQAPPLTQRLLVLGRLKVYKAFKEGQKRILVATDLVGRGIDIERVNIVINYDMPETDERHGNGADTYLHRVRATCAGLLSHSGLVAEPARAQAEQSFPYRPILCNRWGAPAASAPRAWPSHSWPRSRTRQC